MDMQFPGFILVCCLLTITPGVDMALVTKNVLAYSKKEGWITAAGICTGLLIYALISSSGLIYILAQSPLILLLIKYLGAYYLMYLGSKYFHSVFKKGTVLKENKFFQKKPTPAYKFFLEGLITNLLNPKIMVFYLLVIPQFIDIKSATFMEMFSYSAIQIFIGGFWLYFYSMFIHKMSRTLHHPPIKKSVESLTGILLISLGLKIALQ